MLAACNLTGFRSAKRGSKCKNKCSPSRGLPLIFFSRSTEPSAPSKILPDNPYNWSYRAHNSGIIFKPARNCCLNENGFNFYSKNGNGNVILLDVIMYTQSHKNTLFLDIFNWPYRMRVKKIISSSYVLTFNCLKNRPLLQLRTSIYLNSYTHTSEISLYSLFKAYHFLTR